MEIVTTRTPKSAIRTEVPRPRSVPPARAQRIADLRIQLGRYPWVKTSPCRSQKAGFQTGHQNAPLSHDVGVQAYPPSQDKGGELWSLNGPFPALNEADFCLLDQKFELGEFSYA